MGRISYFNPTSLNTAVNYSVKTTYYQYNILLLTKSCWYLLALVIKKVKYD